MSNEWQPLLLKDGIPNYLTYRTSIFRVHLFLYQTFVVGPDLPILKLSSTPNTPGRQYVEYNNANLIFIFFFPTPIRTDPIIEFNKRKKYYKSIVL